MLEKKSASGVHLTPKEMQVTNLLLNEEEEAPEEAEMRREEAEEESEDAERPPNGQKKMAEKLRGRRSEESDEEGKKVTGDVVSPSLEDPADKITFNPGPDIPIIAGMPDAELLDEEHTAAPEGPRRCTDLVPYIETRLSPLWYPADSEGKGKTNKGLGSLCAPPGMAFSAGKLPPPRKPASLSSLDFEAVPPKLLASLPRGMGASKNLPDLPVPKMSFPGNSAIVGFLEQKSFNPPVAKITVAPPPAPVTPAPSSEVGRLFSPPGEEGLGATPVQHRPRPHFDPCASPLSPPCSPVGSASPFSRSAAATGGGGVLFPHLQVGMGSSSSPRVPSGGSSRCCQEAESAVATPTMENSAPGSGVEMVEAVDGVVGASPPQMDRKVGSYVWFEDEATAGIGDGVHQSAMGSPSRRESATVSPRNMDRNAEDEWEWVRPDGGWGWLVLAGSMLVNALVPGMVKSFGVLFLEFLRVFHASPLAASWIPALCYFLYSSLGPVACILSNRFSYRTVTFLGGFLAAMGMILSYFAHSITYLYLSYGILVGAGAGLAFPPGVFIVASYFDKRLGLANGLCVSGSALGSILLPPLLRFLLVTYGYRGAVLLMGGITFHVWVGAMFYHPVEKHMKRVRRQDLLIIESAKSKEAKVNEDQDEGDALAQTALLPRSEAVPIPGQRKVFWYVGKSPGEEEDGGVAVEMGGDARRKPSTVQQQASLHRRRRRSFSPVDERPLVEVDEEEEAAFQNAVVKGDYPKKVEVSQEVDVINGKPQESETIIRKEWRSGSRQRKTSRGFAESVPEEVEGEEGTDDGNKGNTRLFSSETPVHLSQGTAAALADSTAMLGSTQSHLHHLSPKPSILPRSLSVASYASTSTAPPPAPMGTLPPALSASSSSFRFVSSIHHGSALAALQTEGSVSVLAASTFTLKSVGQAVGWDGGLWERIRSNLLGSSGGANDQRHRCKACNSICRQIVEKPQSPKMSSIQISGKNLPALERISNHHSLDRKQRGQVEERKISVASFISAKDVKIPSGNMDVPRRYLNCQCCTPNCTPIDGSEMNGLALSHDSLQAQDWVSSPEIPSKDDGISKIMVESKCEKEKNNLDGQFVRTEDNGNLVDLTDITLKPGDKKKSPKKSTDRKSPKRPKRPPQNVPKKKLFDLSLLSDSMYLILLLSNSTSAIGYTNFTILLPAWAASLGFSSSDASLLLSVVAATDLVGRVGGAALSDLRFMPRRWYYVGGLAVSGAVLAMLPFFATGPALWSVNQDNNIDFASGSYTPSSQALVSGLPPVDGIAVGSSFVHLPSLPIQEGKVSTTNPSFMEHETKQSNSPPWMITDNGAMRNSSRSLRFAREVQPTSSGNIIYTSNEGKNHSEQSHASIGSHEIQSKSPHDEQYVDEEAEKTHISSPSYLQLAAACSVFGLASGAYVGVTAALFSDMLGPERLASSFGLSLLANGILQLAGPPLCGLALSKIPADTPVEPTVSPISPGSNAHSIKNTADVMSPPGPGAYAPIISTLGLFLVAGAGMWVLMPSIERKRRQKEGGVMI